MWDKGVVDGKSRYCEEGAEKWKPLELLKSVLEAELPPADKPVQKSGWIFKLALAAILLAVVIIAAQQTSALTDTPKLFAADIYFLNRKN